MLQEAPSKNVTFIKSALKEHLSKPKSQGLSTLRVPAIWQSNEIGRIDKPLMAQLYKDFNTVPRMQDFH